MSQQATKGTQITPWVTKRPVLFLLDSGAIGGGPRNILAAAHGLAAHGWNCTAICGDDGPLAEDLVNSGVATTALPIAGKYRFVLAFPTLVRLLRREQPAIVFACGPIGGSVGALAARLAGVNKIVYYAGYPSYYADHDPLRRIRNAVVERVACSCSSIVWCVSTLDKQMYAARQPKSASKLHVVPLCVTYDLLERLIQPAHEPASSVSGAGVTLRERLGVGRGEMVVAYVGRLVPEKGVDVLLRAWPQVLAGLPEARLLIVGDGPERYRLVQLANTLGIVQRVTFAGAQRDVAPYYLLADVIAIPSRYEPGGTVATEAMAAGKPVIATRVHAFIETVVDGECGRLVPPEDPVALADGLLWALQSRERIQRLGSRARERALAEYTEERMAERLHQLLTHDLHVEPKRADPGLAEARLEEHTGSARRAQSGFAGCAPHCDSRPDSKADPWAVDERRKPK